MRSHSRRSKFLGKHLRAKLVTIDRRRARPRKHEGSVTYLTYDAPLGQTPILEYYRYDVFGQPVIYGPDNQVRQASLYSNRFLFTGREYNANFGFYEYRARAYHPSLGRFMSEDPKLFVRRAALAQAAGDWSFATHPDEAELNLFRYCGNDPVDFSDPMGLDFLGYDSAGAYFHDVGQFYVGYGHAVGDTVGGIAHTIAHPISTAQGMASAASHPVQTAQAAARSVVATWNSGPEGQGRIIGNVAIAIATAGSRQSFGYCRPNWEILRRRPVLIESCSANE